MHRTLTKKLVRQEKVYCTCTSSLHDLTDEIHCTRNELSQDLSNSIIEHSRP